MTERSDERVTVDPVQQTKTVGLYPDDIDAVEKIRRHYGLDGFGQAVRRAIRVMSAVVDDEQTQKQEGRAA